MSELKCFKDYIKCHKLRVFFKKFSKNFLEFAKLFIFVSEREFYRCGQYCDRVLWMKIDVYYQTLFKISDRSYSKVRFVDFPYSNVICSNTE